MSAFVLFDVREIRDQEKLSDYRGKVFATVEHFGGRYRVLGGLDSRLEGDWTPAIPVLIEFDDLETAKAWYASDVYAPLKRQRLEAAVCDAVLLQGFDHNPLD